MIAGSLVYAAGVRRRSRARRVVGVALMFVPPVILAVGAFLYGGD